MRVLVSLSALLLVACHIEPSAPHWVNVCVASHSETKMVMASCGPSFGFDGKFHVDCQAGRMRIVNKTICDKYERQCRIDPQYKGYNKCEPEVQHERAI